MSMQQIASSQQSAEVPINENFETLEHQAVYGKRHNTTSGLTWGYYGGRWGGFAITAGTLSLTASNTNYVVVAIASGVISVSTSNTNWNNDTDYVRVYKITTGSSTVSAVEDHRAGPGGVHGGGGGAGAGSVDLTTDVTGLLPLANGGTGAALTDPNADRILFWDDSAGATAFLTPGTGLSISGTSLNAAAGGDASTNTATSVVGEVALFADTSGKLLKRATGSGLVRLTSGVQSTSTVATADIDADAVTNAKLANVATQTIKGRTTASTGDPEDLTAAQAAAVVQGDGLTVDLAGFRGIPQNSQSAAYTLVAADAGKHIYHPSADTTARTWTIPANGSVAFPIGTSVTFVNDSSAGAITISITTDTLVLMGTGTTGSRTLAANGVATAVKVTSTRWVISGTNLT